MELDRLDGITSNDGITSSDFRRRRHTQRSVEVPYPSSESGRFEEASESLESRDWVIYETEFGAMGEREKLKVQAPVDFERTRKEKFEIGKETQGVGEVGPHRR